MRFIVLLWALVELLQVVVIAMLAIGYRDLRRRLGGEHNFTRRPPRSVTDE